MVFTVTIMFLGILLKVQQFIHYNKVAIIIMQSYKCIHDSYDLLQDSFNFLSSRTYKWESNTCYSCTLYILPTMLL